MNEEEKVKILCRRCEGQGRLVVVEFTSRKGVVIVCPKCDGKGYVIAQKWRQLDE